MNTRPEFGKAPIRCGKTKCTWRGFEGDLKQVPSTIGGLACTKSVCPTCGNDDYMFMTPGEVKAWNKKRVPSEMLDALFLARGVISSARTYYRDENSGPNGDLHPDDAAYLKNYEKALLAINAAIALATEGAAA